MLSSTDKVQEMTFLLDRVFGLSEQWQASETFHDYNVDLAEAILNEAQRFGREVLLPLNRNGDEQGCRLDADGVKTPDGFVDAWAEFAAGGWPSMASSPDWGGQGMPKGLSVLADEIFYSSNSAFMLYSTLSVGAALAIDAHASPELKARYLEPIVTGRWGGVMDLTEPQAGSDLGALRTKATDNGDGSFSIEGSKMFITGGDQDMCENIIHLVLARLEGAPEGHRGISLFLVPKININDDESLGDANKLSIGSIEHKMGLNGSATCVVNFDGAQGFLVGEPNQGLAAMFTMMNYERLSIGVQGLASGVASFDAALEYAHERKQGRAVKTGAPAMIVEHPDVLRMLMTQKVLNEAGRALAVYASNFLDLAKSTADVESSRYAALLTPLVKAFLTDLGLDITVIGQQVFGGHGYVREWGQEQWVRDARIAQIYEGTNGIQAQDLLKRKVFVDGGETIIKLLRSQAQEIDHKGFTRLSEGFIRQTIELYESSKTDPNLEGAISVDYLHAFGYLEYLYLWQRMASAAVGTPLSADKTRSAEFFECRVMPKFDALMSSISAGTRGLF